MWCFILPETPLVFRKTHADPFLVILSSNYWRSDLAVEHGTCFFPLQHVHVS